MVCLKPRKKENEMKKNTMSQNRSHSYADIKPNGLNTTGNCRSWAFW